MQLSPDQQAAREAILANVRSDERVSVLTGPAGSGKTTLVRTLLDDLRNDHWTVRCATPTGKAAVRLREVLGSTESVSTIHSALYKRVEERDDGSLSFSMPRPPVEGRAVLIVDEASMVDEELGREILDQMPSGTRLLYVGDREQLPPVAGLWGPDFDHPTAALTEIHRQAAENPIIALSAAIRTGGKLPKEGTALSDPTGYVCYERKRAIPEEVVAFFAHNLQHGEDVAMLTWTNRMRVRLNNLARVVLGHRSKGAIVPGDRILTLQNNRTIGLMNGEVSLVTEVGDTVAKRWKDAGDEDIWGPVDGEAAQATCVQLLPGESAWVHPALFEGKLGAFREVARKAPMVAPYDKWLYCTFGFGITVHKSQGSQFDHVAFVVDDWMKMKAKADPAFFRRLVYTAVTRAVHRLVVFDV